MAPLLNEEELSIDPYELLGLKADSTELEAQKAYRKMSLKCHPDRNPNNPTAAHQFHLISLALSILTDPSKRAFLNTRHAEARAKAERTAAMDGKRRVMVEALLAREKEAELAKVRRKEEVVMMGEEERVKEQGKRMREKMAKEQEEGAERDSKRVKRELKDALKREQHQTRTGTTGINTSSPHVSPPQTTSDPQPPIDPLDLTFSLQCPPFDPSTSTPPHLTSSTALQTHLSNMYGLIAHVLLKPGSSSTSSSSAIEPPQKKRKPKGPTAVIEFAPSNWAGCWACWKDNESSASASASVGATNGHAEGNGKKIAKGAILKWAGGEEPAWVGWAERRHAGPSMTGNVNANGNGKDHTDHASGPNATDDNGLDTAHTTRPAPTASPTNRTTTTTATTPSFPTTFPSTFPSSFPSKRSTPTASQVPIAPSRNFYEEDTLFKMRQSEFRRDEEKRRLEEQIRMEDEREV